MSLQTMRVEEEEGVEGDLPFLDDLLISDEGSNLRSRRRCQSCERPASVCWCRYLPNPKIEIRCKIVILQHPNEVKRNIRTALMAEKAIANHRCRVVVGKKFCGEKETNLRSNFSDKTYLLFPGADAVDLESVIGSGKPEELSFIILDGTWDEAKKLYSKNAFLQKLPKVQLNVETKSIYVVRTQPVDGYLSTLETVAFTLGAVEETPVIQDKLLSPLHAMCNFQVNHGAVHHDSKEFKKQNSEFVKKGNWKRKKHPAFVKSSVQ